MSARRSRKILLVASLLSLPGLSGTASANITALDPSGAGSPTTVAQAIVADGGTLGTVTANERAFGATGAPSPMGVGCDPALSTTNPNYCTAATPTTLAGFPTSGSTYGILSNGSINSIGSQFDQAFEGDFDFTDQVTAPGEDRGEAEDYTVISLAVNVPAQANCLSLDYRFFSDEYPEYVGSEFNDAFIAELDGSAWSVDSGGAIVRDGDFAASPSGNAVSVNGAGPTAMFPAEAAGTYFNAASGRVTTKTPITPGTHTVHLAIFDANDSALDSAVFLDRLSFITESAATCQPPLGLEPPKATTPPPAGAPSNQFTVGSTVTLKKGSGFITFSLPGPGTVKLSDGGAGAAGAAARGGAKKKGKKRRALVAPTSATATQAGPLEVPFKLTKAGKKALKGKKKGMRVRVVATFTPVGGTPSTQVLNVTVK